MFTFVITTEKELQIKAKQKGHFLAEPLCSNTEGYNEPLLHVNGVKKVSAEFIEIKVVFNVSKALKENGVVLHHPNGGQAWGHKFFSIRKSSCMFETVVAWYKQNRQFFLKKGSWKSLDLNKKTYHQGARLGHLICDYYVVTLNSLEFECSKDNWLFLPIDKLFIDERLKPKFVYRGMETPADSLHGEFEDYSHTLAQKYNFRLPSMVNEKNLG